MVNRWDYKKEEDYDSPLIAYNQWATLKNTEWRCIELALDPAFKYSSEICLSEILRYFKSRGTNYGFLFRWKGKKGAVIFIKAQINKTRREYGLNEISVKIDYTSKPQKQSVKRKRTYIPRGLRKEVFMRDNYTCKECGAKKSDGATLHIDHIIPVSKGGTDTLDNLQTLCSHCNLNKSNIIQ